MSPRWLGKMKVPSRTVWRCAGLWGVTRKGGPPAGPEAERQAWLEARCAQRLGRARAAGAAR